MDPEEKPIAISLPLKQAFNIFSHPEYTSKFERETEEIIREWNTLNPEGSRTKPRKHTDFNKHFASSQNKKQGIYEQISSYHFSNASTLDDYDRDCELRDIKYCILYHNTNKGGDRDRKIQKKQLTFDREFRFWCFVGHWRNMTKSVKFKEMFIKSKPKMIEYHTLNSKKEAPLTGERKSVEVMKSIASLYQSPITPLQDDDDDNLKPVKQVQQAKNFKMNPVLGEKRKSNYNRESSDSGNEVLQEKSKIAKK